MKVRKLIINDSSHIDEARYYPDTSTLYLRFVSGSIYRYDHIKPNLFGRLAAADSVGAEFAESIRFNPGIPYQAVDGWPEDK